MVSGFQLDTRTPKDPKPTREVILSKVPLTVPALGCYYYYYYYDYDYDYDYDYYYYYYYDEKI